MKPPLKVRTSCSLLKVEIAFAAWAVSPRTKVSAVGPCEQLGEALLAGLVGGEFGQPVLDDRGSWRRLRAVCARSSAAWGTLMPR